MKLIISKKTALEFDVIARNIVLAIEPDHDIFHLAGKSAFELDNTHANHSVTEQDGNVVMEINDEGLLLIVGAYLKIAKAVAPFIKPFMALINVIDTERRALEAFFDKRKPSMEPGTGRAAKERYMDAQAAEAERAEFVSNWAAAK